MTAPTPEPAQPGASDPGAPGGAPESDDLKAARHEAGRYRTQLRDAEGQRDTALASLKAARQHIAEGQSGLEKPGALWAAGVDVDTLFAEDGTLDAEALKAAVDEQAEKFGLVVKPTDDWRSRGLPKPDPSQGAGSGAGLGPLDWAGALRVSRGHVNP